MLGFDPFTLPVLVLLASTPGCPDQARIDIDVRLQRNESPYITNVDSRELTARYGHDPDSTLSTDGNWMVGGVTVLTDTGLQSQIGLEFTTLTNYKNDTTCFAVTKINYEIQYSPQVYIAQDFKNMGCRYSQVLMHEKRHVQTDIRTITDFIPDMRKKIGALADHLAPQGPYPNAAIQQQQKRLIGEINQALAPVWTELVMLRRKRQAEIDTEANYLRDTGVCPGQFPKFDGSK
jgi:hypothetical protein